MQKTLLSIVGPTAIGKTRLAVALAKYYDTAIISADSRQFYKEMKIGTAVPTEKELAAAPHHFIQHRSIFESYTVGDFEREAIETLKELFISKNIVILVGGSGLYVDAITKGLDNFPDVSPKIREGLNTKLEIDGIISLQEQLKNLDPLYFNQVDIQNPHRLIRALEICMGTGKPYSSFLNKKKIKRAFQTITVGIEADRAIVYDRINKRVDHMLTDGLLEEAKLLLPYKTLNALQTVGYRELFAYFEGEWSLDFAIAEIKKNTRRFAKRQLTWFHKAGVLIWVSYDVHLAALIKKIEQVKKN